MDNSIAERYPRWRRRLAASLARLRHGWLTWRTRHQRIPIAVLVSDPVLRGMLEAEVERALGQLRQRTPLAVSGEVAVIVQHSLGTEHPFSGCYQTGRHADGRLFALIRLALHLEGRTLTRGEMLAVLAEQWIGLALQQSSALSVLIPVDLPLAPAHHADRPSSDPLVPHLNGHGEGG